MTVTIFPFKCERCDLNIETQNNKVFYCGCSIFEADQTEFPELWQPEAKHLLSLSQTDSQ